MAEGGEEMSKADTQCKCGHTWSSLDKVHSEGTAIQYQGNICPKCSNKNVIVYGFPIANIIILEEKK